MNGERKLVLGRSTEHYSAIKRKDVLTPATTHMNFESIMLSERSQTQKAICCMIPFEMSRISKSIETESKLVVAREWRVTANG